MKSKHYRFSYRSAIRQHTLFLQKDAEAINFLFLHFLNIDNHFIISNFATNLGVSLFALMQKGTKKIKAVLKSYDFAKAPAARKKLAPPASGLKQFFASSASTFAKSGFQ